MASTNVQVNQAPQMTLDIHQLSKDLRDAMHEVKEIQRLIIQFIDTIVVRKNDVVEKETLAIKATIQKVHTVRTELDKIAARYSKLRLIQIHPVPLGNAGYITLDPTEDRNDFYQQLIESYTWLKNLDHDATKLSDLLKQQFISKKPVSSTSKLIDIYHLLVSVLPNVTFKNTYLSSHCCIEIKIGVNFHAYLFFSALKLTSIKVKSVNEAIEQDLMDDTNHHVFQKMTNYFVSKILNIPLEDHAQSAIKFVRFLLSYKDIFKIKCNICGKHLAVDSTLKTLLPPLKKLDTGNFIHFSCQP